MAELSREDVDTLANWGGKVGKSVDELKKELLDMMSHDMIRNNAPDEESRLREGMRLLKNRYSRAFILAGNETDYLVMVLGKTAPRKVQVDSKTSPGEKEEREVMNIVGIGKKAAGGEYKEMRLAAWGADITNTEVEPLTVYKANVREKVKGGGQMEYTVTQNTKWTKQKVLSRESAAALIRKTMETLPYTKYSEAAGNNKEYLVEGNVIRHTAGERDGRKFAMYGVRPNDMEDFEVVVETQGLAVWIAPDLLKWGEDSLLMFIGRFNAPKEGRATSMNADVVIPIIEFPLNGGETSLEPLSVPPPTQPHVEVVEKPKAPTSPKPAPTSKSTMESAAKKLSNIRIVKDEDADPFAPE